MTGKATERASMPATAGPEPFFQAGKTEMAVIGVGNRSAATWEHADNIARTGSRDDPRWRKLDDRRIHGRWHA